MPMSAFPQESHYVSAQSHDCSFIGRDEKSRAVFMCAPNAKLKGSERRRVQFAQQMRRLELSSEQRERL
jgi:hypothetical protein